VGEAEQESEKSAAKKRGKQPKALSFLCVCFRAHNQRWWQKSLARCAKKKSLLRLLAVAIFNHSTPEAKQKMKQKKECATTS